MGYGSTGGGLSLLGLGGLFWIPLGVAFVVIGLALWARFGFRRGRGPGDR